MSTLKALLKDVPVEWKELKEVCVDFIVPMRDRPKTFDGPIPWCRIEDIEDKFFNKSKLGLGVSNDIIRNMNLKVFPTGSVICSCSASIGVYAINTQPLITNQTFIGLVCGSNLYNRYLLYFMETQTANLLKLATTGTIPYISRKKFEDFKVLIPYPNDPEKSLEIQQEIVRVLDGLSEQNKALTTALAQEIDQRKKQYAYYREALFRFEGKEVEWKTLGEVCDLKRGTTITAKSKTDGVYPVISGGQKPAYFNGEYNREGETITIAGSGAYAGHVLFWNEPIFVSDAFSVKPDLSLLITRYVYFILLSKQDWIYNLKKGVGVPHVYPKDVAHLHIPIPYPNDPEKSLEIQQEIVRVLDGLSEQNKQLTSALAQEIELRNKQYEYYRNLLLSFDCLN